MTSIFPALLFSFLASAQFVNMSMWKPKTGYLVITSSTYQAGTLGGRTGANTKCLNDLQNYPWMGKQDATLNTSKVHAFICDSFGCNNLLANTYYTFANAGQPQYGGDAILTNASGIGPGDREFWNTSRKFGPTKTTYWTGRAEGDQEAWPTTSQSHCSGWTDILLFNGTIGTTVEKDERRWSDDDVLCSSFHHLVCIVDP